MGAARSAALTPARRAVARGCPRRRQDASGPQAAAAQAAKEQAPLAGGLALCFRSRPLAECST